MNPYKNKVVFNGTTLIDLTADTVTAGDIAYGVTAHDASGAVVTGTIADGDELGYGSGVPVNLNGTTWYFNDTIDMAGFNATTYGLSGFYALVGELTSDNTTYGVIGTGMNSGTTNLRYFVDVSSFFINSGTLAYDGTTDTWADSAYRTISIIDVSFSDNPDVIAWFMDNATQVIT